MTRLVMMFMIKTYDMIEKKKTLHSYFLTVEECKAICILLLVMLLLSCEQRDPQAEYELLRETVFSSPQEGEAAAQKYIDDFYGKDRARITEASEIRHQYRLMDGLFSDSFSSFVDFMKKSHDLNKVIMRVLVNYGYHSMRRKGNALLIPIWKVLPSRILITSFGRR